MDANFIMYLGRYALETALLISSPILLVCMFSGIIVSLFQAVTSLRDMTLTMVPKLLAVGITAIVFGNWMVQVMIRFSVEIFEQIRLYGQ